MKLRCPSCGAAMSLDVLIAHDDARALIVCLATLSDDLAKSALRYLTLFRPASRDLSFDRVAKLLNQLLPDIQAEQIERNRRTYPAPKAAWVWAFNRCVEARDAGKLKTPLTTHGFLLENITFWTPEKTESAVITEKNTVAPSKLRAGVAELSNYGQQANRDGDFIREEIATGFSQLATLNLKGRPAAQDLVATAEIWAKALYKRHIDWHEPSDRKRLRRGFEQLLLTSTEWPVLQSLINAMPPRLTNVERGLAAPKQQNHEVAQAGLAAIKATLKGAKHDAN